MIRESLELYKRTDRWVRSAICLRRQEEQRLIERHRRATPKERETINGILDEYKKKVFGKSVV